MLCFIEDLYTPIQVNDSVTLRLIKKCYKLKKNSVVLWKVSAYENARGQRTRIESSYFMSRPLYGLNAIIDGIDEAKKRMY